MKTTKIAEKASEMAKVCTSCTLKVCVEDLGMDKTNQCEYRVKYGYSSSNLPKHAPVLLFDSCGITFTPMVI